MWKNMKIMSRLMVGFVVVALFVAVVGVIAARNIWAMNDNDTELYEKMTIPIEQLGQISEDFQKVRVALREALLAKNSAGAKESAQVMQEKIANIDKVAVEYETSINSDEMRSLFNEFKDSRKDYTAAMNKVMEALSAGKLDLAVTVMRESASVAAVKRYEAAIDVMTTAKTKQAKQMNDNNTIAANLAVRNMAILSVIAVIIAIALGFIIAKGISRPLKRMVDAGNALAIGDVDVNFDVNSKDEVGQLAFSLCAVVGSIQTVAHSLELISKGDMSVKIQVLSDKDVMNQALLRVARTFKMLVKDVKMLSEATVEGRLETRGDADKFEGGYRDLVSGINETLDAVLEPVNEVVGALKEMAKGNLSVSITGDYTGDHALMKDAMNNTLDSLNELLSQATAAVEQVAAGSRQISTSSQNLSHGATTSAAAVEEISSSMQQMASQTVQNSDNAISANKLSISSRDNAGRGNSMMGQMVTAMQDINLSGKNISKIIKVIDEIAFQTNLLALNAAVEAARAGKHGKGFTVVAEEVRSLAQRSAEAAKETAELIEDSISKTAVGTKLAQDTSQSLEEIVIGATKVTDLISEIAAASKEQSQGIAQINNGLGQVDQVTQQNTASSEELAAAAEELSAQAIHLKDMLEKFKLRGQSGFQNYNNYSNAVVSDLGNAKTKRIQSQQQATRKSSNTHKNHHDQIIVLDDDNFGKF